MRKLLAASLLIVVCSAVQAQTSGAPPAPRNQALHIAEQEQQAIMASIAPDPETGGAGAFSRRLFEDTTFSTALIRLTLPDAAHSHGIWSEVFLIKQGSGVVETGGVITGDVTTDAATHGALFVDADGQRREPTEEELQAKAAAAARRAAQGDQAGSDIEGGIQHEVGPGDLVLIPAGVPHRWLRIGEPVVYLVVKFPKAE